MMEQRLNPGSAVSRCRMLDPNSLFYAPVDPYSTTLMRTIQSNQDN